MFTGRVIHDIEKIFTNICKDFGANLEECNGEKDRVHLLITYPQKIAISSLLNSLKGVSSRMIRQKNYPETRQNLWGKNLWSASYFFAASCGGASIDVIRKYIQEQDFPKSELSSRP